MQIEREIRYAEGVPATASMPMRRAATSANDERLDPYDVRFESPEPVPDGRQLRLAVESKKRDNVALGETLVQIGLLEPREMLDVRIAQAGGEDLCNSLMVVSAIRSRLGEILLNAKQITSAQLEFALELQRKRGGLLGEILVSQGWLDRATLDAALATQARSKRAHAKRPG
ncbi:MAG TPA: hypothetical protein VF814_17520 [Casimicrobiaceae bacterium]